MLANSLLAVGLVVVTVAMHVIGLDVLLRAMMWSRALDRSGFWFVTRFVIGLSCWLILIHLAEISFWGLFYFSWGCLPDAETAFYFSGVTYTSTGYGDVVLARPWRMLAPIETLTGTLMCGLSTGLFFVFVLRWIANWMRSETASEPPFAADLR